MEFGIPWLSLKIISEFLLQGFKLKMDDLGNIMIKRLTKSPVYAVNTSEENSLDHEILKLQNGLLEFEKPFKLFDMKKFQQNVNREMKRQYPERRWVQILCVGVVLSEILTPKTC